MGKEKLPQGWEVGCADDGEGNTWLSLRMPNNGASASYRCRTKTDNGPTIASQVAHAFALASRAPAAQASATIQFLHNVCADVLLALRNCDRQPLADMLESALQDLPASATIQAVPRVPTEEMQNAARDWAVKKYGIGIGKDAALGCWQAMWDAATIQEPVMVAEPVGKRVTLEELHAVICEDGKVGNYLALSIAEKVMKMLPAAPMVADPAGVAVQNLELVIARLEQIAGNFTDDYRNAAEEALVCARSLAATVKAVPSDALEGAGWFGSAETVPSSAAADHEAALEAGDFAEAARIRGNTTPLADKTSGGE